MDDASSCSLGYGGVVGAGEGSVSGKWTSALWNVLFVLGFWAVFGLACCTHYCSRSVRQDGVEPAYPIDNGNEDAPIDDGIEVVAAPPIDNENEDAPIDNGIEDAPIDNGIEDAEPGWIRPFGEIAAAKRALLISQGVDEAHASVIAIAQTYLTQETLRLASLKGENRELLKAERITITIAAGDNNDHNDILLPDWRKFAKALSSFAPADEGYIKLHLQQIQIGPEVSGLLLKSFQKAPIQDLVLCNNGPGIVEFAAKALEADPTMSLYLDRNPIASESEAAMFARTLAKHPGDRIAIVHCSLGQNSAAMAVIVPSLLLCLEKVCLMENDIGMEGARLISGIIRRNPANLASLDLRDNVMGDDAAQLLADSLATNTSLRGLSLKGNPITQAGATALTKALCWPNSHGLNQLYEEANHTCRVDASLGCMNSFDDPHLNRSLKIFITMLPSDAGYSNLHLLDAFPLELIPKVLVLLRGERFGNLINHNALSAVFCFIREWSLPLLYTSRRVPEHRRSERIRKKKVKELMGR